MNLCWLCVLKGSSEVGFRSGVLRLAVELSCSLGVELSLVPMHWIPAQSSDGLPGAQGRPSALSDILIRI